MDKKPATCIDCGSNLTNFDNYYLFCQHCFGRLFWVDIIKKFNVFTYDSQKITSAEVKYNGLSAAEVKVSNSRVDISTKTPSLFKGLTSFINEYLGLRVNFIQTGIDPDMMNCPICSNPIVYKGEKNANFTCSGYADHFTIETVSAYFGSILARIYPKIKFESDNYQIKVNANKIVEKTITETKKCFGFNRQVKTIVNQAEYRYFIIDIRVGFGNSKDMRICVPQSLLEEVGTGILDSLQHNLPKNFEVIVIKK